jgi:hypothetical protein
MIVFADPYPRMRGWFMHGTRLPVLKRSIAASDSHQRVEFHPRTDRFLDSESRNLREKRAKAMMLCTPNGVLAGDRQLS